MKYGNTTAASIPIALSEAWEQGKLNQEIWLSLLLLVVDLLGAAP